MGPGGKDKKSGSTKGSTRSASAPKSGTVAAKVTRPMPRPGATVTPAVEAAKPDNRRSDRPTAAAGTPRPAGTERIAGVATKGPGGSAAAAADVSKGPMPRPVAKASTSTGPKPRPAAAAVKQPTAKKVVKLAPRITVTAKKENYNVTKARERMAKAARKG